MGTVIIKMKILHLFNFLLLIKINKGGFFNKFKPNKILKDINSVLPSKIRVSNKRVSLRDVSIFNAPMYSSKALTCFKNEPKYTSMKYANYIRGKTGFYDGVPCGRSYGDDCSYSCGYTATLMLRKLMGTNKRQLPYSYYSKYATSSIFGVKHGDVGKRYNDNWLKQNFNSAWYPGGSWSAQSSLLKNNDYSVYSIVTLVDLGDCRGHYVAVIGRGKGLTGGCGQTNEEYYVVIDNTKNLYFIPKVKFDKLRSYRCAVVNEYEAYRVG